MKNITCLFICLLCASNIAWGQKAKWLPNAVRIINKETAASPNGAQAAQKALRHLQDEGISPSIRHANRQQAKPPITKFRPDKEELALWAKLKTGHLAGKSEPIRGLNKSALIDKIVQRHNNMNSALVDLFRLEKTYGQQDFFHMFAAAYYNKVFGPMAPSFYDLLKNISITGDRNLQTLAVTRMQFLFSHKKDFMSILQREPSITRGSWRLQWLPLLSAPKSNQFNPNRIVLAYERTMQPSRQDVTMEHITPTSYVRIDGKNTRVLYFQEDLKYLPELYKRLLYNKDKGQPLFVAVDKPNRVMFVFNDTRTKWIRISQHEFSDPDNLHLHINRLKRIYFKTAKDHEHYDNMVINVTLPLKSREDLTPEELEDIFFNQTLKTLAKTPNVYISYQSVY